MPETNIILYIDYISSKKKWGGEGGSVPSSPLLKYRFLTENFSLDNFQPLPQDQFPYLI